MTPVRDPFPRARRASLLAALALAGLAACSRPLPEEGSADAELYRTRCGSCHTAYQPHSMTSAMWKIQFERMESRARSGELPPDGPERDRILAYLARNAGG